MQSMLTVFAMVSGSVFGVFGRVQPGVPQPEKRMTSDEILAISDEKLVPAWAVKQADRNAALLYLRASLDYSRDARMAVLDVNWIDVGTITDEAKMPAVFEKASKALRAGSTVWLGDAVAASKLKKCDFECAYEGGVGMLLPHLSHLRAMARGMRVEARQLVLEGKRDEAAALVAAIIRMGMHTTSDRVLISSLVGIAVAVQGADEAAVILSSGGLSSEAAADLREAVQSAMASDAFRCKEAAATERDLMLEWFRLASSKSTEAGKVMAALQGGELRPEVNAKLKGMNAAGIEEEIAKAKQAFGLVIEAWDAADASAKLGKIEEAVGKGEHGVVAQVCVPSFAKARKAMDDLGGRLRAAEAKLPSQR